MAVVEGCVWVDCDTIPAPKLAKIKKKLTVQPKGYKSNKPSPIKLYAEKGGKIGLPRAFYAKHGTGQDLKVEVTDVPAMERVSSLMKFEGPYREQADAIESVIAHTKSNEYGGFILEAGCGFGKTNVAIQIAYLLQQRTLILVHKEFFLTQWRERIKAFLPGAKVGEIRQGKADVDGCDFVIGMLQSLARDRDGRRYRSAYRGFGLVISDECHRIGAQTWADVIPRFSARWRMGLTATPRRRDGAEDVFKQHIGETIYKAKTMGLVPAVRRLSSLFQFIPFSRRGRIVTLSDAGHVDIVSQLIEDEGRNEMIADAIIRAAKSGRKVMVVSDRLAHLRVISHAVIGLWGEGEKPTVDYYTGEWFRNDVTDKKRSRSQEALKKAESAQIIFATRQMVAEGLDVQPLDVIVLATPMSDVEQAVGRVRRHCLPSRKKCERLCPWRSGSCEGKPSPVVIDVVDGGLPITVAQWMKRLAWYTSIGVGSG